MENAFTEKRALEPVHEEIYRGYPLEVFPLPADGYFALLTVNLTDARQIGVTCGDVPCESVQTAMRAGRLTIDALVKGAAVEQLFPQKPEN